MNTVGVVRSAEMMIQLFKNSEYWAPAEPTDLI